MIEIGNEIGTVRVTRDTPVIFTIGHSNLDLKSFIELLKDNAIDVVVDVL